VALMASKEDWSRSSLLLRQENHSWWLSRWSGVLWHKRCPFSDECRPIIAMDTHRAYGPLEGVRVFPGKTFAFVNYLRAEDAARARDELDGQAAPALCGACGAGWCSGCLTLISLSIVAV
jgi:hypothetical protein